MAYSLGDIVAGIPAKSGGRNNWGTVGDGSLGIVAAQQAVMEITETAELEELKYQTPVPPLTGILQMTAGTPVISIASILATIQNNTNYPQFQAVYGNIFDITDIYTFWLWFQGGVGQSGRSLEFRVITALDMYTYGITSNNAGSYGTAPPVYYSRFGSNIQVGPAPDQAYYFFTRCKLRHPWPAASLANAPIFAPDSWQQIFQYAAVYQLAKDEGQTDQSYAKTALDFLKQRGMDPYTLRQVQRLRDERHNSRSLSLRTQTYTHA